MNNCLLPRKDYDGLTYHEDILGERFEQRILELEDDYEGKVVATLVRCPAHCFSEENLDPTVQKAVLYVHGFNDYFFQKEAAYQFNERGYNFYALDLRKCGRSHLPHQRLNDVRDLRSYYEEILTALKVMYLEGNQDVVLFGHSLGGLVLTLFAKDYTSDDLFDGLILNSPFYGFNGAQIKKSLIPFAATTGRLFPDIEVKAPFSEEYGKSLHKNNRGKWEYNLEWKPHAPGYVNLGWVRAVHAGHRELSDRFKINQPVLIMCAGESLNDLAEKEKIRTSDIILDVKDISAVAGNIEGEVDIVPIEGGIHDLLLSEEDVRKKVYTTIFGWLLKNDFL